jgi:hypothetical protein
MIWIIFRMMDDPCPRRYLTAISTRRRLMTSRSIREPYATFSRRRIVALRNI